MEELFNAWLAWPVKARWASAIAVIWFADALFPALHANHPAAAFGERFVALGICYLIMAGSVALAIKIGPSINSKMGKQWPAWVVGVLLFTAAATLQQPVARFFGVTSVLKAIQNSDCFTDWDGRSNTSDCD